MFLYACVWLYVCVYIYIYIYIYIYRERERETYTHTHIYLCGRTQWSRVLRRGSAASRFIGLWVRIPPGHGLSVSCSCECCILSGGALCVGLDTRPQESYRLWCVWLWSCNLDNGEALALAPWKKTVDVFCVCVCVVFCVCVYMRVSVNMLEGCLSVSLSVYIYIYIYRILDINLCIWVVCTYVVPVFSFLAF